MGDCTVDSGSCADNVVLVFKSNFMKYCSFYCKYCANEIILPSVHTVTSAFTALEFLVKDHKFTFVFLDPSPR